MPSETFSPQQFTPPSGGNPEQLNSTPNVSNYSPGQESQSQWSRSISRSKTVKKATTLIITTRSQLSEFLKKSGIDLMTSAIEFQQNGDFIQSSYVIYTQQNSFKERLSDFLIRYPSIQPAAEVVRDNLRAVQNQMQIITRKDN